MKLKLLIFLLIIVIVSGMMMKRFPSHRSIVPDLYKEPDQIEVIADSIDVEKGGITYTVQPLYAYELYGLIVSDHNTGGVFDYYHSQWGDVLNVKDVCVVWGDNLKDDNYKKMKYKNGSWTCYFSSPNREVWNKFYPAQLSNNHLLVADDEIARTVMKSKKGDQISFKGYLSEYSHGADFKRGTSISRDDKSGGACETIFLTDFQILKQGNVFSTFINKIAKWCLTLFLLWLFISFFLPPSKKG